MSRFGKPACTRINLPAEVPANESLVPLIKAQAGECVSVAQSEWDHFRSETFEFSINFICEH